MGSNEGFHDYTLATNWERFVASIEQTIHNWSKSGVGKLLKRGRHVNFSTVYVQAQLRHKLPWRRENYRLSLYLPRAGQAAARRPRPTPSSTTNPPQVPEAIQGADAIRPGGHATELVPPAHDGVPGEQESASGGNGEEDLSEAEDETSDGEGGSWGSQEQPTPVEESLQGTPTQEGGQPPSTPATEGWEAAVLQELAGEEEAEGEEAQLLDPSQIHMQISTPHGSAQASSTPMSPMSPMEPLSPTTAGHASRQQGSSTWAAAHSLPRHGGTGAMTAPSTQAMLRASPAEAAPAPRSMCSSFPPAAAWWPQSTGSIAGLGDAHQRAWAQPDAHKLQCWFGIDAFLLLEPVSFSGRVLDEGEATSLLSALSIALANTGLSWPGFVPVHDPLRDGYWGWAHAGAQPLRLFTDSLHVSRPSPHLSSLDGQLAVFAEQLLPYSRDAAAACQAARPGPPPHLLTSGSHHRVVLSASFTYCVSGDAASSPDLSDEDGVAWDDSAPWRPWASQQDPVGVLELDVIWEGLHLTPGSPLPSLEPSTAGHWHLHALESGHSTAPGLGILARPRSTTRKPVTLHKTGQDWLSPKAQMSLLTKLGLLASQATDLRRTSGGSSTERGSTPGPCSFTAMLQALLTARSAATHASSIGELCSSEWWAANQLPTPPAPYDSVLESVLRDLLEPDQGTPPSTQLQDWMEFEGTAPWHSLMGRLALHCMVFGNARGVAVLWTRLLAELRLSYWDPCQAIPRMGTMPNPQTPSSVSPAPRHPASPPEFAGRPDAQHSDWDAWPGFDDKSTGSAGDAATPNSAPSAPQQAQPVQSPASAVTPAAVRGRRHGRVQEELDLGACLVHQKLQLLNSCVGRRTAQEALRTAAARRVAEAGRRRPNDRSAAPSQRGDASSSSSGSLGLPDVPDAPTNSDYESCSDEPEWAGEPQGVAGVLDVALINHPERWVNLPVLQPAPLRTLDMLVERHLALAALAATNGPAHAQGSDPFTHHTATSLSTASMSPADQCSLVAAPQTQLEPQRGGSPDGSDARAELARRLMGDQLASDMAAFKAANPGAVLEDFAACYGMLRAEHADHPPAMDPAATTQRLPTQQIPSAVQDDCAAPLQDSPASTAAAAAAQPREQPPSPPVLTSPNQDESRDAAKPLDGDEGPADISQVVLEVAAPRWGESGRRYTGGRARQETVAGSQDVAVQPKVAVALWPEVWAATAACTAEDQKPLTDPMREGERALHHLETLQPLSLSSQLCMTGAAAAVVLLAACEGADLPPVQRALQRFHRIARATLWKGSGLPQGAAALRHSADAMKLASLASGPLEDSELELLLSEFHFLEQAVVLAESLCRRLPGCRAAAEAILANVLEGPATASGDPMAHLPCACLADSEQRDGLLKLLQQRAARDRWWLGSDISPVASLGDPVHNEWVLWCHRCKPMGAAETAATEEHSTDSRRGTHVSQAKSRCGPSGTDAECGGAGEWSGSIHQHDEGVGSGEGEHEQRGFAKARTAADVEGRGGDPGRGRGMAKVGHDGRGELAHRMCMIRGLGESRLSFMLLVDDGT